MASCSRRPAGSRRGRRPPAGSPQTRAEQPAVPRPAKGTPPERLEVPSPRETVGTPRPEVTMADRPVLEHPVDVRETAMAPPPVGALVSEGGPTVVLDRSYVLGREPQNDPAVQSAAASPIVVRDPDHLVSRVHARVSVEDGSVYVRDAPSVSGTFVAAPGAEDWTRVGTEPTQLL